MPGKRRTDQHPCRRGSHLGRLYSTGDCSVGQATIEQQSQSVRQCVGVLGVGLIRELTHPRQNGLFVRDRPIVDRGSGSGLRSGVDERTSAVAVTPTRGTQCVEHADKLFRGVGASRSGSGPKLVCPDSVHRVQVRQHEVFFRPEMLVEGRLGHPGFGDDQIHPDGPDATGVEQPERGIENALSGRTHLLIIDRPVC